MAITVIAHGTGDAGSSCGPGSTTPSVARPWLCWRSCVQTTDAAEAECDRVGGDSKIGVRESDEDPVQPQPRFARGCRASTAK
jgi:hypothetical protein